MDLLSYQGLGWGHEHYLALWVPSVIVVHDNSSYESFPQSCRQGDQSIVVQTLLDNVELVVSDLVVGWVDPQLAGLLVKPWQIWYV